MINSDKKKNLLNNAVCAICKQPINVHSDVADICKECFLKCAETLRVLEYLRNTKIDNLNIINSFINNNSFPVNAVTCLSDTEKAEQFIKVSNDKANENSISIIRQSTCEKIKIDKDVFILGSSVEKADYVVDTLKTISRVHAKIECISGHYLLMDMNSKNGTKHNSVKILPGEKVLLKNGDEFSLSTEVFSFLSE